MICDVTFLKVCINMKKCFVLSVAFIVSACGSTAVQFYEGPVRSNNETAIISLWTDAAKLDKEFSPSELSIMSLSLNDKNIETNADISILAGSYSLKVRCTVGSFSEVFVFEIDAVAAKKYAVIAEGDGDKCKFKKLSEVVDGSRFVEL